MRGGDAAGFIKAFCDHHDADLFQYEVKIIFGQMVEAVIAVHDAGIFHGFVILF
jgi:hypothetical protein